MIKILIFLLFISLTFALPTCNLSLWVNSKDFSCSGSPGTIYSDLTYDGNCTMFPNDPSWTTYKLIIDISTKTVQHFFSYNFKNCYSNNELFFAKTPISLGVCAPLYLVVSPQQNVTMGSLIFDCQV